MPWASYKLDDRGLVMRDENNIPMLTGYCVEVQFKYQITFIFLEKMRVSMFLWILISPMA